MEKRTLLAIVLSMIVLVAFQFFNPAPKTTETPAAVAQTAPAEQTQPAVTQAEAAPDTTTTVQDAAADASLPVSLMEMQNDNLLIRFNEATGDIHNADMLVYTNSSDENDIVSFNKNGLGDYLRLETPVGMGYAGNITRRDDTMIAVFTATRGNLVITKKYELKDGSYIVDATVEVANIGASSQSVSLDMVIGPGLGDGFEKSQYIFEGPMIFDGQKLTSESYDDVDKTIEVNNPKWIGFTSKYFLFASMKGDFERAALKPSGEKSSLVTQGKFFVVGPGDKVKTNFDLFIGPKTYDLLKSFDMELEEAIDFGWFFFLAIPLLKLMNYLYGMFGNYGMSIIVLTIIVKAVTFPLTNKSMVSMKKMSAIQPEIQKVRDKFKSDPQKMNTAMMDLYKKHGVNPMGGCLPMVLQIPIFFALYKALLVSIELKGAPFFGWIVDLSMKDPYYITPVIMGVTMFLQQKMTPSTADPMQQKIFLLMPVVFTFLFLNFPAGLVVYWLTNNVLTISQQYIINKKIG